MTKPQPDQLTGFLGDMGAFSNARRASLLDLNFFDPAEMKKVEGNNGEWDDSFCPDT